jgi:hypothetical protein
MGWPDEEGPGRKDWKVGEDLQERHVFGHMGVGTKCEHLNIHYMVYTMEKELKKYLGQWASASLSLIDLMMV